MSVLTLHLWGHETMTQGQSVSSCFYRGKSKQTTNQTQSEIKERTYLQRKASHNNWKQTNKPNPPTLTQDFFNVYPRCTELQKCNCSNISLCFWQVLIFWGKNKVFLVFACHLMLLLRALTQKSSFLLQKLLTKMGIFKSELNHCRCPFQ